MLNDSSTFRSYIIKFLIIFSIFLVLCPIYTVAETNEDKKTTTTKSVDARNTGKEKSAGKDGKASEEDASLYDYEEPTVEEESYAWLIIKTIIVLAALVGGFYYFFKFVTKKTGISTLGEDVIKVLSIVPVGQNKYLQVVDVAGRILVLGVSDANINLVTEITDRDEIDRIRLLSSKSSPVQPGGFQQYISKQLTKFINKSFKKSPAEGEFRFNAEKGETDRMDYLKKQRDRLKGLNGQNDEE